MTTDNTMDDEVLVDVTDLFESIFQEIVSDAQAETESGSVLHDTVTVARLKMVHAQKAKSLLKHVKEVKLGKAQWITPTTELILLEDGYDVIKHAFDRVANGEKMAFLRACPEFARHGVLESLKVIEDNLRENWKHLVKVMKEEDPNGCLILQPFIPATSSAVMAPQKHAAISLGHDGVTAGDGAYMVYTLMNPEESTLVEHIKSIGHEKDTYEVEFVYERVPDYLNYFHPENSNQAQLTQIRGSPPSSIRAPPFTYYVDEDSIPVKNEYKADVYPKEIDEEWAEGYTLMTADIDGAMPDGTNECKEVWVATGLEEVAWLEANITKELCPDGFFISEPNGSMMSHVMAHARQHSIPYVAGVVEVGDVWTEGSNTWVTRDPNSVIEPLPYKPFAPDMVKQFNDGLNQSKTHWRRQQGWLAHFYHQWMAYGTNGVHTAYLAGGFCGWLAKAMLSVCLGEMRYAPGMKKDAMVELWPVLTAVMGSAKWQELTGSPKADKSSRKNYYALCEQMEVDYEEIGMALDWCAKQFSTGWSGAYGGKAWSECAKRGVHLCDAITDFQKDPCEETLAELSGAVNSAKNAEHNNGSLFNKYLNRKAFDYSDLKTHSDGTKQGLFPHTPVGIKSMFQAFEIANHFTNGEPNEGVDRPVNDWVEMFKFLKGKGATYWRHNFITIAEGVPEYIRDAAISVGYKGLHHNNKYSHEDDFIPCGIYDCTECAKHDVLVSRLQYGDDIGALLLTPQYPEVYFALGNEKSSVHTYSTCQILKERDYSKVTPEMWVDAWGGLNNKDPLFPELSRLLTKFVKNQMSDDKEWTNAVLKINKEEEE